MRAAVVVLVTGFVLSAGVGVAQGQACPTLTVAADGSGQFTSVQAAVDAVVDGVPTTIRIKPGRYREVVRVPATKTHLTMLGTTRDPADVVIDFDNASGMLKPDGTPFGTTGSATVTIAASDFTARYLTFSNSFDRAAHPEITATQAVALKATGDRMLFDRDRFLSHQDTLYADTASVEVRARQYYVRSTIVGDVDFMFGRATAVFDRVAITALDRGGKSQRLPHRGKHPLRQPARLPDHQQHGHQPGRRRHVLPRPAMASGRRPGGDRPGGHP